MMALNTHANKWALICSALLLTSQFTLVPAVSAQESTTLTCAASGKNYQVGEIACIPACYGQEQLAKCEQSGAGAAWTSISNTCPSASIPSINVALAYFTPGTYRYSEANSSDTN